MAGETQTHDHAAEIERKRAEIARLEAEIARLAEFLSDPEVYSRFPAKAEKATSALSARQTALADAEAEWLALEERATG
jgi:ABC transport system ATP-binding/permease protein